jgi:hypothetical protein
VTNVQVRHFQGTTTDAKTLDALIDGIWVDVNAFLLTCPVNDCVDVRSALTSTVGPYGSHVIMHYDVIVMYLARY